MEHFIFFRQRHGITSGSHACRDNGNGIDRSHIRKQMEQDRMTSLMECCNPFFLICNNAALLLGTDAYFDKCFLDIILADIHPLIFCCNDGCFVQQVFQICTGKSCRSLGNLFQIHIICQRFVFRMNGKDLFTAAHIRTPHIYFTVKPARTQ